MINDKNKEYLISSLLESGYKFNIVFDENGKKLRDKLTELEMDLHSLEYSELRRLSVEILIKSGMNKKHAEIASDVLLKADVRGVDTHGVSNMLRNYVQYFFKPIHNFFM